MRGGAAAATPAGGDTTERAHGEHGGDAKPGAPGSAVGGRSGLGALGDSGASGLVFKADLGEPFLPFSACVTRVNPSVAEDRLRAPPRSSPDGPDGPNGPSYSPDGPSCGVGSRSVSSVVRFSA